MGRTEVGRRPVRVPVARIPRRELAQQPYTDHAGLRRRPRRLPPESVTRSPPTGCAGALAGCRRRRPGERAGRGRHLQEREPGLLG